MKRRPPDEAPSIRRDLALRAAAVRGIRVVPDEPGPEFLPVLYACDAAPDLCGVCAVATCPHGRTPGLAGAAETPQYWRPKKPPARPAVKQKRPPQGRTLIEEIFGLPSFSDLARPRTETVQCVYCGAIVTGTDPKDALRRLLEHTKRAHPDGDDAA